jgi:Xaa-Pro aminopeptidase
VIPATRLVEQLRARKSPAELARIRRAVDVTVQAHREAMRLIEPGLNEFEAQALIEYTFRRLGADRPSFATIVGSGPNATTLHYNADDRPMRAGELVVLDIGASYAGYAADVTRTLPVSGRFTTEQRALYQIVRDAQAAAERAAAPGASWLAVQDSARVTLAAGLTRLGLIDAPDATYECGPGIAGGPPRQCSQVGLYYMHGLGHGIGLEVHDPAQFYVTGIVQPGDAFTLEPGAYVRERLLALIPATPGNAPFKARIADVVRRYANAGVRIEDDYLVTEGGVEWVSRAPREVDEVEAAMREPWRGPAPRDARAVEAYRPR